MFCYPFTEVLCFVTDSQCFSWLRYVLWMLNSPSSIFFILKRRNVKSLFCIENNVSLVLSFSLKPPLWNDHISILVSIFFSRITPCCFKSVLNPWRNVHHLPLQMKLLLHINSVFFYLFFFIHVYIIMLLSFLKAYFCLRIMNIWSLIITEFCSVICHRITPVIYILCASTLIQRGSLLKFR